MKNIIYWVYTLRALYLFNDKESFDRFMGATENPKQFGRQIARIDKSATLYDMELFSDDLRNTLRHENQPLDELNIKYSLP